MEAPISGYPYHLSGETGEEIALCLDGEIAAGERLAVEAATGEAVGHVVVRAAPDGNDTPPAPWRDGFQLPSRATYKLDPSLPSGVYTIDGGIPFVHRSARRASMAVLIPSHTAAAFNAAGGRNFYRTLDAPPADVLSFHRPLTYNALLPRTWPFVRWFAKANPHPWDTTYLVDSDLERPDALEGVELLIVIGRSEYWTRAMRERFDAHVDRGGRVLLLCSEIMYWQVRVDLERHQLYRYRRNDPHPDPLLRTTVWHDPSLRYPVYPRTGGELRYGGHTRSSDGGGAGWQGMRIVCSDSPLLRGSGLATGDIVRLPDASVWDGAPVELGRDGVTRVDFGDSPPWRHEVIGYNLVTPAASRGKPTDQPAASLWIALRHMPESGTVVHCGTMGWCGANAAGGNGPDSGRIQAIILRMIDVLLDDAWPFSPEES